MTAQEIKDVLQAAKESGVSYLKCDKLEVHFNDIKINRNNHIAHSDLGTVSSNEVSVKPLSNLDDLSDEEILYYATPYFDELQAKKKDYQDKLNSRSEFNGENTTLNDDNDRRTGESSQST